MCGSTRRVDWALESGQRTAQAGTPEDEDVQGPPSRQAPRGTAHLIDADLVRLLDTLHALLWINDPQALDNLETTVFCLGNVHVHSSVMLTGHHFS